MRIVIALAVVMVVAWTVFGPVAPATKVDTGGKVIDAKTIGWSPLLPADGSPKPTPTPRTKT